MKICIATGIYPPSIGGPATYSKLLFDTLPKHGIDVTVLSFDEVRHLPKIIRHFVYFLKLIKSATGCDIIFAQDPVSVGYPAFWVSKMFRKKFFIRIAGDYAWEQGVNRFGITDSIDEFQSLLVQGRQGWRVRFFKFIQSFVAKNADQVITPSKYFRDLVSGWGVKPDKIRHIYNGIEDFQSENNLASKESLRANLNISQDKTVLISSGRLLPWKGFKELINIFSNLNNENIELYILGDGEQESELKKLISEKGLQEKVFLPGKVNRDIMFKYLQASDVFVLNTSFESFSFAIVEAMQVGLPILSTNVGNIPEVVEDGKHGFLVEPNNEVQIKEKLCNLIDNPDLRQSLGNNAKEQSKLFSIENMINNLKHILNKY